MQITERGSAALRADPKKIDVGFLRQFPEYLEARQRKRDTETTGSGAGDEASAPPLETLENSYNELKKTLAAELLDLVKKKPPVFFERLVLQLMQRLGYGSRVAEAAQHLGGSGDGGVDGPTLAELMIEYDLGVATFKTLHLKKVDSDFFDED